MIVGIDAGNFAVKVVTKHQIFKFPSVLGEYRERDIETQHGEFDFIYEFEGKKGFAGTLALFESEFAGTMMGTTKNHQDALIRILLALHYLNGNQYEIVVGQPISTHKQKDQIKAMLTGNHKITVNGITKIIHINQVEVAIEGGSAFWSMPKEGLIRIIDIGSATVNCASLLDGRYLDKDSFTLPFGCNTNKSDNVYALVEGIVKHTSKKWNRSDTVYIAGGIAEKAYEKIKEYYFDSSPINPFHNNKKYPAIFANAIGMYQIGRVLYGDKN